MADLLGGVVLPSGVGVDLDCSCFTNLRQKNCFRFTKSNAEFASQNYTKADRLGRVVLTSGARVEIDSFCEAKLQIL